MVTSRFAAPIRSARRAQWVALLVVVVLLLKSALTTAAVPVVLRALVVATALTAALDPAAGLVVLSVLAPLGYMLAFSLVGNWGDYPFDMSQAVTLAYFAGYLWSMRHRILAAEREPDALALPAALLTLIILASMLVQVRVLQVWHDYPLDYAASLFRFLHTDYLVTIPDRRAWVDGRGCFAIGAYLIEGIALLRCVRAVSSGRPTLLRWVGSGFAITAIVAAALGLTEPMKQAEATHQTLSTVLTSLRWSTPVLPSLNTAGPFFMLLGFTSLAVAVGGTAITARLQSTGGPARGLADLAVRTTCGIGALAAFAVMWFTQTRSGIVAGIATVAASLLWWTLRRLGLSRPATAAVTAAGAMVVIAVVVFVNPLHVLAGGANQSLEFRYRFAQVGWRMFSSAPFTGVGVGQYEARFLDFASPEVLRLDPRINNAHNYLLWLGAELGIIGVIPFVWFVGRALWDSTRNLIDTPSRDRQLAYMGLLAFFITWPISQPINLQTVAFPFWLAFGLAATPWAPGRARAVGTSHTGLGRLTAGVLALVAVASVPGRVRGAVEQVDFSRVTYGLFNGGLTEDQRPFRWAGPHVRMYMRESVPAVEMSLGAAPPLTPKGAEVRVAVNERPAESLTLAPGEWRRIHVAPRPTAHPSKYWRIDIEVRPLDLPAGTPAHERRIGIAEIERALPPATP